MTYQVFVYKLCFSFSLALIKVINGPANRRQKRRSREARMLSCLIYFFAPFPINYIVHNYVIPQAMPHAIPPFTLTENSLSYGKMTDGFAVFNKNNLHPNKY